MGKLVVLDVGEGDFTRGFAVVLRIGHAGQSPHLEFRGRLPPAPDLPEFYHQWQTAYYHWGNGCRWGNLRLEARLIPPEESGRGCQAATQAFEASFRTWLDHPQIRDLREHILEGVGRDESAQLILQTQDGLLRRLPWHLWPLLDRRSRMEFGLSVQSAQSVARMHNPVRVLAILGNSDGIDVQADRALLNGLPNAQVKVLTEPARAELSDRLFEQPWDILFFAGHSCSQPNGETGELHINARDRLSPTEVRYAVEMAVRSGLQLAIFNSCDGLGLAQALADLRVPHLIVMREPVPDRVAQAFLRYFFKHFSSGESLHLSVRKAREQLQGLEKEFPCASWLPVLCQNPAVRELKYPQWNWRRQLRWAGVATVAGAIAALGGWQLWQEIDLRNHMSWGERVLLQSVTNGEKTAGVSALFWKNYPAAIEHFQRSLKQTPNDPETLIYLNNAKIGDHPALNIAVPVPIGSNPNVAQEILRGVAQAQAEINDSDSTQTNPLSSRGIRGLPLKVQIARDDNQAKRAKRLAEKFVNDRAIVAVVRHNASDASLAASDIYQRGKLVMITPTSITSKLTDRIDRINGKNYIFRTTLSSVSMSDALANYTQTMEKNRVAMCRHSTAVDQSSVQMFEESVIRRGGKIIKIDCDLASPNLQPDVAIQQAVNGGANSLLLSPFVDDLEPAFAIAKANQGRLSLLGISSLLTLKTLQAGAIMKGIIFATPWHVDAFPDHPFPRNAEALWKDLNTVTWRTASAYDATQVIAKGLQPNPTREGLQQALSEENFSWSGATGLVQFLPSGDRTGRAVLVHLESDPTNPTQYRFGILSSVTNRVSLGERILTPAVAQPHTTAKQAATQTATQAATQAFAKEDFFTAVTQFQSALKTQPRDPELWIYLQNAQAAQQGQPLKIATSVPIGSNLGVAQEILRGVAQAQGEINRRGGIQGRSLQVMIANDDNHPTLTQQIANLLTRNAKILAVVGHNAGDASIQAAPIYDQDGLVMITPTSAFEGFSAIDSSIFRMVPDIRFTADKLANYWVRTRPLTKVAVCSDTLSIGNELFRNRFIQTILSHGGEFIQEPCDFASPNFDPKTAIARIRRRGANTLLLAPHVDRIEQAIALAQANQGQLVLLGSNSLATPQTLTGKQAVNGLTLAVPWHSAMTPRHPFVQRAIPLWGSSESWRMAMAYDATWAIATALQKNPTRQALKTTLKDATFSLQGVTGKVQFLTSGERQVTPEFGILLQVQPTTPKSTDYQFVPLPQ